MSTVLKPPTYLPSYVEQSLNVLQGERFVPMAILGPRAGRMNTIGTPLFKTLGAVVDDIGEDRRQRRAARLTDMLRMTVYRFVSPEDTLSKIQRLSKRERKILGKSEIAK